MAKVGDTVRYLNAVGGGKIVRIEGQMAYVDDQGFETPVLLRECVVVSSDKYFKEAPAPEPKTPQSPAPKAKTPAPEPELPYVETAEGEKLNIIIGYEAADIKKLSSTTYDAYLVNDSNYYLYFTYMTRANDDREWTLRRSGLVEPGIQLLIDEIEPSELAHMDRVALQYIAFKKNKPFAPKAPGMFERRLDTTKFFKLHCFQPNPYFDGPVIALNVVVDDSPERPVEVDARELQRAMRQKAHADAPAPKPAKKPRADEPLVVDLHIAELVDTTAGMSNADMLNMQIDHFRKVMDQNLKNHGKKIVFIHGKGDGVLRQALLKELGYRYKGCEAQDASFREYGFGATQVKIK